MSRIARRFAGSVYRELECVVLCGPFPRGLSVWQSPGGWENENDGLSRVYPAVLSAPFIPMDGGPSLRVPSPIDFVMMLIVVQYS